MHNLITGPMNYSACNMHAISLRPMCKIHALWEYQLYKGGSRAPIINGISAVRSLLTFCLGSRRHCTVCRSTILSSFEYKLEGGGSLSLSYHFKPLIQVLSFATYPPSAPPAFLPITWVPLDSSRMLEEWSRKAMKRFTHFKWFFILANLWGQYNGNAFKIPMMKRWAVIVSGREKVDELRKAPADVASSRDAAIEVCLFSSSFGYRLC